MERGCLIVLKWFLSGRELERQKGSALCSPVTDRKGSICQSKISIDRSVPFCYIGNWGHLVPKSNWLFLAYSSPPFLSFSLSLSTPISLHSSSHAMQLFSLICSLSPSLFISLSLNLPLSRVLSPVGHYTRSHALPSPAAQSCQRRSGLHHAFQMTLLTLDLF